MENKSKQKKKKFVYKIGIENEHHIIEATFKAFSRALKAAIKIDDSYTVPSTKGVIG